MSAPIDPPQPPEQGERDPTAALDVAGGIARLMGDRGLFARVLERFRKDYRRAADAIRAALAAGDTLLAQRLTHTLKGASGMIEAGPLHRQAMMLEQALRGPGGDSQRQLDRLEAELDRVLRELDSVLIKGMVQAAGGAGSAPLVGNNLPDPDEALRRLRDMLDIGDGAALEILDEARGPLTVALGEARLGEVAKAVNEFDFELAMRLFSPPPARR
jgi:HPt (histidine-containing phosphotransfer) domain-containing protein